MFVFEPFSVCLSKTLTKVYSIIRLNWTSQNFFFQFDYPALLFSLSNHFPSSSSVLSFYFFFPILLLNISQNQGDHCYKCTCKSGRDVKCLWESCRHIILIFDVHIYVCEAVCVATLCLKSFYFAFGFNLVLGCWCGYQKVRLHGGVKL